MATISLIKYEKPRILAIDFSKRSIEKIANAGFNIRKASTGILTEDKNEIYMPCSVGDVEILLFHIRKESLHNNETRNVSVESIEKDTGCISALVKDVWRRGGLSLLFIEADVDPIDMEKLGIQNLGVLNINREYYPANKYQALLQKIGLSKMPEISFQRYKGEDFMIDNHPITEVYKKYLKDANHIIISTNIKDVFLLDHNVNEYPLYCKSYVKDNSANQYPLCIEINAYDKKQPRIVLLPTFGDRTIDAIIDLLNEYAKTVCEHLFTESNYVWLENYKATPVQSIINRKGEYIEEAIKRAKEFDIEIQSEEEKYIWMDNLLIGKDEPENEPFKDAVIHALEFLGFRVEDIDLSLPKGEPRREDIRIYDDTDGYFAVCEAKTTETGAKEQMYHDLHKHMMRYMRETNITNIKGLLFVNHSLKLEPSKRYDFYKSSHIHDELREHMSSAVDSCFLHELLQKVLRQEITQIEARQLLKSGHPVFEYIK